VKYVFNFMASYVRYTCNTVWWSELQMMAYNGLYYAVPFKFWSAAHHTRNLILVPVC